MAQSGYTPIQLYRTTTAAAVPLTANLAPGELAINIKNADMALFAENASGTVTRLINNPAGLKYPTADGSANQVVQTNGSGVLSFTTVAKLTTNTFSGAQIGTVTALTSSAAAVAINLATNNNFSYLTAENSTLSAPSNPVAGQSGVIVITQGGTARTLAYNTFWKFAGGTVPTLTATASAVDSFAYYVESATRATCQLIKDVK